MKKPMTEKAFWAVIDDLNLDLSLPEEQIATAIAQRLRPKKDSLVDFAAWVMLFNRLAGRQDKMLALFAILSGHPPTDDSYEYFRNWILLKGQKFFYTAMIDANQLHRMDNLVADGEYPGFESLETAIAWAYSNLPIDGDPWDHEAFEDQYEDFAEQIEDRFHDADFQQEIEPVMDRLPHEECGYLDLEDTSVVKKLIPDLYESFHNT